MRPQLKKFKFCYSWAIVDNPWLHKYPAMQWWFNSKESSIVKRNHDTIRNYSRLSKITRNQNKNNLLASKSIISCKMGLYLVYHDLIHSSAVVLGIVLLGSLHYIWRQCYIISSVYTYLLWSDKNGWTHCSFWRLLLISNTPASTETPSSEILQR